MEADFAELERTWPVAADARARVSYSDRPGTDATRCATRCTDRWCANGRRDWGNQPAADGRIPSHQDGAVRPALTIDDGATVVTDNYLKLRIAPGMSEMNGFRCGCCCLGTADGRDRAARLGFFCLCVGIPFWHRRCRGLRGRPLRAFHNQLAACGEYHGRGFPHRHDDPVIR